MTDASVAAGTLNQATSKKEQPRRNGKRRSIVALQKSHANGDQETKTACRGEFPGRLSFLLMNVLAEITAGRTTCLSSLQPD
jgi:hypothetical protein